MVRIDVQSVKSKFSETVSVDYSVTERNMTITRDYAEDLYNADIIDSKKGTKFALEVFMGENTTICEIDYVVFGSVGYIHWTSVPEEFRNKGIATIVRENVVNTLFSEHNVSTIYSYPVSYAGKVLAEKNGFYSTDDLDGLTQWMKLTR